MILVIRAMDGTRGAHPEVELGEDTGCGTGRGALAAVALS